MKLDKIFDEVSKQMMSDFAKARHATINAGIKGSANEDGVSRFLREYLPKSLDISTGQLVDSNGCQSKQLDVIISDTAKTPIFYRSGDVRIVPVECAYSVIEVKAFLDKAELKKSYGNMKSAKSLEKKAYYRIPNAEHASRLYGKVWRHWPLSYFIFAYDSPSITSLRDNMNEMQLADPVHQRIDCVCILEKGIILNRQPDGLFDALPQEGGTLVCSMTKKPLLFFYTLISHLLNQATMNNFRLHPYLGEIKF